MFSRKKKGFKTTALTPEDEIEEVVVAGSPPPPPSSWGKNDFTLLTLPPSQRLSMILPHLSQRFPLLREENGQLVSLDTMEAHLKNQRKTGQITSQEVDAALTQFRTQAEYESPELRSSSPSLSQFRPSNELDGDTRYTSSSASSLSSSMPLPSSTSEKGSPLTPASPVTAANFRRAGGGSSRAGGGSSSTVFGGRVVKTKMGLSPSTTSLKSSTSKTSSREGKSRRGSPVEISKEVQRDSTTNSPRRPSTTGRRSALSLSAGAGVVEEEVINSRNVPSSARGSDSALSLLQDEPLDTPGLAVIDQASESGDLENVAPQFHQLSPPASDLDYSPSTSGTQLTLPPGALIVELAPVNPDSSYSTSPSDHSSTTTPLSMLPTPITVPLLDHDQFATATRPDSISQLSPTSSTSPLSPNSILSSSTTERALLDSTAFSFDAEVVDSFPSVPFRDDSRHVSGSGPFDLSSSSRPMSIDQLATMSRRAYATTSGSTGVTSSIFSPIHNASNSSLVSSGSSYHAGTLQEEDHRYDLNSALGGESSSSTRRKGKATKRTVLEDDEEVRMNRTRADQLLAELGSNGTGTGEVDLALEDLVLIQETLVRSASRKAAARRLDSSSNSPSGSDLGRSRSGQSNFTSSTTTSIAHESTFDDSSNQQHTTSFDDDSSLDHHLQPFSSFDYDEEQLRILPHDMMLRSSSPASHAMSNETSQAASMFTEGSMLTPSTVGGDVFEWSSGLISPVDTPTNPMERTMDHHRILEDVDDQGEEDEREDEFIDIQSFDLGAPIQLDPNPPFQLRAEGTRRDPSSRMSTVVREVRNQANAATISLRKQGSIGPSSKRVRKIKSVRNLSISQPTFVSGPDILAVSIPQPEESPATSPLKSSGSGKGGIGLRFKMLLGKPKTSFPPDGPAVPFVEFDSALDATSTSPLTPIPSSTDDYSTIVSNQPQSPDYPRTPEGAISPHRPHERTRTADSSSSRSPASSNDAVRSLTRLVTKLRRGNETTTSAARSSPTQQSDRMSAVASTSASPASTQRQTSIDSMRTTAGFGLAIVETPAVDSSRAPVMYDVGSARRRRNDLDYSMMPSTAPLAVLRPRNPPALAIESSVGDVPYSLTSAPLPTTEVSGRGSVESMNKLWTVANDLGLPLESVRELVDLSFKPNSNSTSRQRIRMETPPESTESGVRRTPSSRRPTFNRTITPPTATFSESERQRQLSSDSFLHHSTVPASTSANGMSSLLYPPPRPSSPQGSLGSRPSSSYAGSLYDLYDNEDETGNASVRRSVAEALPAGGEDEYATVERRSSVGDVRLDFREEEEEHQQDESTGEGNGVEEGSRVKETGDEVWKVVDDLRKGNRESVLFSNDRRFSTHSRHSSVDSAIAPPSDPFSLLVSRHRRNQSSTVPNPRYPSIYVRDEKRLAGLKDGVGLEESGVFLVRPRMISPSTTAVALASSLTLPRVIREEGSIDGWKREAVNG